MYLFEEEPVPEHECVAGDPIRENEIEATCTVAGSYEEATYCTICGAELSRKSVTVNPLGHAWGEWTVATEATATTTGLKRRECSRCGVIEEEIIPAVKPSDDPNHNGEGDSPVAPGASFAAANAAITSMNVDEDLPGSAFSKLTLRSPKQTKTSISLSWKAPSGAVKYVLYGNRCGKGIKPQKIAEVKNGKTSYKFTKAAGKTLKKGKYYKVIVVALDKNNMVVSTSKLIHVVTKGGKNGNDKSVKVSKKVLKKAKSLKKGKTLKLKAKAVPQSKKLKVKRHVKVRYESTNPKVATVNSSGKVTAKSKGTCTVYAYAQDGVYKKIPVKVK
jgi:hypothetical protein